MVSVVLMAGQDPIVTKEHRDIIENEYKEHYYSFGYKPLKTYRVRVGKRKWANKPLIQFMMEKLEKVDSVDDIVIPGDKHRIEGNTVLCDFISNSNKKYTIVDQYGCIDKDVLEKFGVKKENFEECSIAANGLKSYLETKACGNKDHALFLASDTPGGNIEYFINEAEKYKMDSSVTAHIVSMDSWFNVGVHRVPLFFVNDTKYILKKGIKGWFKKREGFRVSSMLYVNPWRVNIDVFNHCYGLRKMRSLNIRKKVRDFLKGYNKEELWERYFHSDDLSIKEVEKSLSYILCKEGNLTIIPTRDIDSTYDDDGTEEDDKMIERFLNKRSGRFGWIIDWARYKVFRR